MSIQFFNQFITWYIVLLGIFNLIRITLFIIGADTYRFNRLKRDRFFQENPIKEFPEVSIIVPAYNEELTIEQCLKSLSNIEYPSDKLSIFIIDDGSKDMTYKVAKNYLKMNPSETIKLVTKKNGGKAHAVNTGIKLSKKSTDIVMCLDSDCSISSDGVLKMAQYFVYHPNSIAVASHVTIIPENTLLNLAQRFEYTLSYQIKRALTAFNIEYIIGGIGSAFSYKELIKNGMYDTDTMTEDIDLTLKLMENLGNKKFHIGYADDVITFAEAVPNISGLMTQRFRWKFGRAQAFYKHRKLFFNRDKKFNILLTCLYLPLEILFEFIFLFEPIILGWFLYISIRYNDILTLLSASIFSISYVTLSLIGEDMFSKKSRLKLLILAPLNVIVNYFIAWSEYYALIKSLSKITTIQKSITSTSSIWVSPKRTGAKIQ
jgi:poly-beta-1,6-N-acetyl-D-glucosamine synthase